MLEWVVTLWILDRCILQDLNAKWLYIHNSPRSNLNVDVILLISLFIAKLENC